MDCVDFPSTSGHPNTVSAAATKFDAFISKWSNSSSHERAADQYFLLDF
jgi:hypothetical protein